MSSSSIKDKVYKFFSSLFSTDSKPDSIIEPLTCLIRLSILEYKPVGTKISVNNNKIQYNDPTILQGAIRWSNGDAREDLHNIFNPIRKAVEWFDKDQEEIAYLFNCSIKGLYRLKKSYHHNSVISHSIQYYIDYINNNINKINKEDHQHHDKKMNNETNTLYLKLKEFWTPREILIINNLFLELENNRQKNEEDSNFNNQQNTLIKAIETLLSNKEEAVSKLLFETTTYLE
jgi:hypothetical protein